MFCPFCNGEMKYVRHFETNRNYGFHECNKCHFITHHKRLHWDDEEVTNNATNQNNTKNIEWRK